MKKNTYSPEEIDELKEWFDTHQDTIPQDMYIEESIYTPNLKETITRLFEQAYIYCSNPKMQGCIVLLQKIKSNIEKAMS